MRLIPAAAVVVLSACAHPTPTPPTAPACGAPGSNCRVVIDPTPRHLPFTAADDRDGSRFVSYSMSQAGVAYTYTRTEDVPKDSQFVEVGADSARAGDIAWWFRFMAVYYGKATATALVYPGVQVRIDSLSGRLGPTRFYRVVRPGGH